MTTYANMYLITNHIEKNIGKISTVFHEIISDDLHIDICHIKSGFFRKYETLVTMGMSALPMNVPDDWDEPKYIELMILLPKGWPLKKDDFLNENNYWPIRLLKDLARHVHHNSTYLGYAHTAAFAKSASDLEPYADNTQFCASIILPSITLREESLALKREGNNNDIFFFTVIPLFKEELLFKINNGIDQLMELFDAFNINDVVNINRRSVIV